jgi:hypothetical protein
MGDSISERAANGDGDGDEADELFPMGNVEGGPKTLKTLIKPGAKVKSTISLASAEVPAGDGIFDPEGEGVLLVTFALGKVEEIPLRAEGQLQSWKVRQTLHPVYVERVGAAKGSEVEAAFAALLRDDPAAAGKTLDAMQKRAGKALATA